MISLHNKRVTVAGLGRFGGGIAVSKWLVAQGARVLVTDQASADSLAPSIAQLDGLPIEFRLGEHRESDFTSADLVVPSPAIPPNNPFILAAQRANIPIQIEIGFFIERCPATILGVTGTKGKSTASTLLARMLRERFTTHLGGNIGGSLLFDLPRMTRDDKVVIELSSYMLEYLAPMKWSPHVGLVTMVTADHLDWHGGLDQYVDAKRNLVRFMSPADFAVLNRENDVAKSYVRDTQAQIVLFSRKPGSPFELKLPGEHNQLNAQAAFAAAQCLGVSRDEAQRGIRDFVGLPHRLQVVHEDGGVTFVNDSIATIPEAAAAANESFPEGKVIQIIGGSDKHLDMAPLTARLAKRCKAVLTIGALGPSLAEKVKSIEAHAAVQECGDLETAVRAAKQLAAEGDIVLLSTGCASYDQFTNFEKRGERFTELVKTSV